MRWELTSVLSALEKLEILEKEWLPIVIEHSYQKVVAQQQAKDMLGVFHKTGLLPIYGNYYMNESYMFPEETFEEYLQKRPFLMQIERIKNRYGV